MTVSGLPRLFADAKLLRKRIDKAWAHKALWDNLLEDTYRYCLPNRNLFYGEKDNYGQQKDQSVFDSSAPRALFTFAARTQALIMPPWQQWSKLSPGPDLPDAAQNDVQLERGLQGVTDRVFSFLNHSNYANAVSAGLKDFGVSTLAMKIDETPGMDPFRAEAVPLHEIAIYESARGDTEHVYRRPKKQIGYIEHLYPGVKLTPSLQQMKHKSPEAEVEFDEVTEWDPDKGEFHSVLIYKHEDEIIWYMNQGEVSPWIIAPADRSSGEMLGRGPALRVLQDVKTLNKIVEFVLRGAAFKVGGVFTSTNKNTLNPLTMRLFPGAILPVESNDSRNPTLRALEMAGDPNFEQLLVNDYRAQIKTAFYNSVLDPTGPVRSASEVLIEDRELLQDSGTEFGKLDNELAQRVIARVAYILSRRGKIPKLKVDGRTVTVTPTSPLAKLQDTEELVQMSKGFEVLTQFLPPEATMLGIKMEEVPEEVWRLVGANMKLVRSAQERQRMQEQAAQVIAQQQKAQQEAEQGVEQNAQRVAGGAPQLQAVA